MSQRKAKNVVFVSGKVLKLDSNLNFKEPYQNYGHQKGSFGRPK